MALKEGTPFVEDQVVRLDGKPYFLPSSNKAGQIGGGRRWEVQVVTDQDSPPKELAIPLQTFHEGSGFTYSGLPNVYDYADGWCAMSPGRLTTWPKLAMGDTITVTASGAPKPWIISAPGGYFYMAFGRYVTKYLVGSRAPESAWARVGTDFDLGASNVIAGRPAAWGGNIYFPVVNSSGVLQVWQQLTPGGSGADTWTAGPAGAEASCFTTWKTFLARANGNVVSTCAVTPTTLGNWSATSAVDNSAFPIIDIATYDHYLMVRNSRGFWSFDENLNTINELPDLQSSVSTTIGAGMAYSNGYQIVPHVAGLVRWRPMAWQNIGPEQEHALEGAPTHGWGPASEVAAYGQYFFTAQNDFNATKSSILSYGPGHGQRGPLIPHCHHTTSDQSTFEALCVLTDPTNTYSFLAAANVSFGRLTARPWIYELPRAGMTPSDDPAVGQDAESVTFFTSRHTEPSRDEQKTYRVFECWVDTDNPASNTPGLQVWASVNNNPTWTQLLDATGVAKTVQSVGFQRFFFPKTNVAVGNFVQLKFVVPAKPSGGQLAAYGIRDGVIRCAVRPLTRDAISTAFTLESLRLPGGEVDPRTAQQMEADLRALAGPNASPVAYVGPNGETGYVTVTALKLDEVTFKEASYPVKVATLLMEVQEYA